MSISINLKSFNKLNKLVDIIGKKLTKKVKKSAKRIINEKQSKIKKNIESGGTGSVALHELTITRKGHGQPLMHTGTLKNSFKVSEKNTSNGYSVGVGISESEKYSDGTQVHIVATTMEFGVTMSITPIMRKVLNSLFLTYLGIALPKNAKKVTIPSRPFLNQEIRTFPNEIITVLRKDLLSISREIKEKF